MDLAGTLQAAVLGISHFSKGSGGRDPVERVTGSLAFGALARVVLCAVKVKGTDGDDDRADAPQNGDQHRHTRFRKTARAAKARKAPPPIARKIRSAMPTPPAQLETGFEHRRA